MRNLKKFAALLLAAVLTLALSVTCFAAVDDTGFSDVDSDAWYAEAVMYCREHNLMNGTSSTAFEPESPLTRAMLVTALYRMEGEPAVTGADAFTDTDDGQWYSNAVLWASQNEIVGGYGNGLFGTDDHVTREDMSTILWRYAGEPASSTANLSDASSVAAYAAAAVNWAVSGSIVAPQSGTTFAPGTDATRAQVAAALMNYDRSTQTTPVPAPDTSASNGKVLVAYFSGTGTTRGVAENIVTALGSDVATLHEIAPEQPYTTADLDYTNSGCRSVTEQHDPSARPAIANSVMNMDDYDVVFLGYPIWNNDAPRIIYTFLESENLSGKTIVPFCTSGGSDISNSVSNIRGLASGATWMEGRRCYGSDTVSALTNWADGLGLDFTSEADTTPAPAPSDEAKVLVAYFSATNTTKPLAEYIADGLNADLYEITPETPYTSNDLNWHDSSTRATVEMNDPSARPAISGSVDNMEQYDIVFIGYPIWWGQAPRIISTFLESYNFSDKTIVPFCTSGSSGMGSSARNLHSLTDGATWLDGQRFGGGTSRSTMIEWVNGLNLNLTAN